MFIQGHVYRRSDLHNQYGGQRQGGISTPSQYPLVCTGYHWHAGPDTTGQPRQMIIFELTPLSAFEAEITSDIESVLPPVLDNSLSLEALRNRALADAAPTRNPVERQTSYRQRSQWIKRYALRRANGTCEGCGIPAPFNMPDGQPYLEVHHIRRLSDGGPDHPRWVIAICPNCHRRAHYAEDAVTYNAHLRQVAQEREAGRRV
jgi:5-methylcytosine-specific restriction enzyme A